MILGEFDQAWQVEADSFVLVTAKIPNIDIYKAIKSRGIDCHVIGDAYAPRFILNAVRDGYELARKIGSSNPEGIF